MARRVFLHIGTMKSATTYLQQWGDLNRDELAKSGVLFPELGLPFAAANDLLGKTGARRETEGAWAKLDAQLRRYDGDAVVSNELLAMLAPRRIKRLVAAFAPAEIHVVVTARDLARVIPSQWQTRLKNGSTLTWGQFATAVCADPVKHPDQAEPAAAEPAGVSGGDDSAEWFWRRQDLPAIVRKWQAAGDRLTIVTVPPAGSPPHEVEARFASVIGVDDHAFARPTYANSSVGAHSAELLRRVNRETAGLDSEYQRMGVRNALARLVLAERASAEPRCGLSPDQLAWVRSRALAMTAELDQLGVGVVGDLHDLVPDAQTSDGGIDPAATSDADLLEAAVFGLAGMARVHTDVRIDYEQLRRDHEDLLRNPERLHSATVREQR